MRIFWKRKLLVVGACFSFGLCSAIASPLADVSSNSDVRGPVLALTWENDWIVGTDRHYTQGFRVTYLDAESRRAGWIKDSPTPAFRADVWRLGYEAGQAIYTPENLAASTPPPDDRPYAGWLYAGVLAQRRGVTPRLGLPVLENFRVQLGVVGPGALAKEEQETAHFVGGFQQARGWHNQLHNEPGFALKYQRAWRLALTAPQALGADFLPHTGVSLGNVDTSARLGGTLRLGWNLPDDFGVQTIDSLGVADGGRSAHQRWGCHLFFRAEGRAVGYNEFLDGDLFRDSPHIAKHPLVGELQGGVAWVGARFNLALALNYRSTEFEGQACEDAFSSVSLSAKF